MKEIVLFDLCKCEHCKKLFSFDESVERLSQRHELPACIHCHRNLDLDRSCGYVEGMEYGKQMWIGSDGEWTATKPTQPFEIEGFKVLLDYPLHFHGSSVGCVSNS